jgi:hypothetical protein
MPHPRVPSEVIDQRGQELYEERIREQVETEENIGKILAIDVETGDYEIADDPLTAGRRLLARHPGAAIFALRIGYNAVYALGGSLTRTAP